MFEQTVSDFQGFNISQLNMDEAWLNISSLLNYPVWIYAVSNDCYKCPLQKLLSASIFPNYRYKLPINVQHGSLFRFRVSGNSEFASVINDSEKICDIDGKSIAEFGVYSISVKKGSNAQDIQCLLETDLEGVNIYSPILAIFAFWVLISFLWHCSSNWSRMTQILNSVWAKLSSLRSNNEEAQPVLPTDTTPNDDKSISSGDVGDEIQGSADIDQDQQRSFGRVPTSPKSQKQRVTKTRRTRKRPDRKNAEKSSDESHDKLPLCSASTSATANLTLSNEIQQQRQEGLMSKKKERLQSLDAFRGLCILIMIFVDDGGGGYYFFRHCTWDGLYVADLAFPWFLWICGVCIPLSIQCRVQNQCSKTTIFKGFLIRSIKLVMLGLIVNTSTRSSAVQLENMRLPGVLQRFGICYFVCSTLYLFLSADRIESTPNSDQDQGHNNWRLYINDLKVTILPWIVVFICVILHTALIFYLPVPDCPTGYLGPAGLADDNSYPPNCVGGAAGYVDRLIFGTRHIHSRPTSQKVYGSGAFDPEGSLGILTSILHTWIGVQAGIILMIYKSTNERIMKLAFWCLLYGFGGIALCGGYTNAGLIPVNKNLWSLSFVLITSSWATFILGFLYLAIDEKKIFSGRPLMETGKNSILLYLGHEVCHAMLPWHYSYGRMRTHSSTLFESTWGTFLWIVVAVNLHNKQLYFVV